jgi:hypothetical protein
MDGGECGAVGGMVTIGNWSTRRKLSSVPLRPPQIPHDVTWAGIPPAEAGKWRLTACPTKTAQNSVTRGVFNKSQKNYFKTTGGVEDGVTKHEPLSLAWQHTWWQSTRQCKPMTRYCAVSFPFAPPSTPSHHCCEPWARLGPNNAHQESKKYFAWKYVCFSKQVPVPCNLNSRELLNVT